MTTSGRNHQDGDGDPDTSRRSCGRTAPLPWGQPGANGLGDSRSTVPRPTTSGADGGRKGVTTPLAQQSGARSPAERRRDTEHRLQHEVDLRAASASTAGVPHLVPLSFDGDGRSLLLTSPTGQHLAATGTVRLALGHTRDVTLVNGVAEVLPLGALAPDQGDRFATRTGPDPRTSGPAYRWYRVTPHRVQAWREVDELAGRELMRTAGGWSETRTGQQHLT